MEHISVIIVGVLQRLGLPIVDALATMPYDEYLKTPQWHRKRHAAIMRANCKCQRCYYQDHLEVHHLTYARRGHELPDDLIVLCRWCHKREHGL